MKGKTALFIVIVFTVILGAAAVYLAITLQKRQVSPQKGKAAEQPKSSINITTVSPLNPKEGQDITITAQVSLGGVGGTLTWSAPGGDPSSYQQTITSSGNYVFTTRYSVAGEQTVTVNLVTSTETLTDTAKITVEATGQDAVTLSIDPATPSINQQVTLTAHVSVKDKASKLRFFANDTQIGDPQDVSNTGDYTTTYTFTEKGTYTLYVKLYDSNDNQVASASVEVIIQEAGGGGPVRPYCSNNTDYPNNMPSCSSLTVVKSVDGYPDWYPGMDLKLDVSGSPGTWCSSNGYTAIKRFSYVDLGDLSTNTDDIWAVVPGSGWERGDFDTGFTEYNFTIPLGLNWKNNVAYFGIEGGYGCVSSPAEDPHNEANDNGRLCMGIAEGWQVWKPCDSVTNAGGQCPHGWLPMTTYGGESCRCEYNPSCSLVSTTSPINILKPPSCEDLIVYKDKDSDGAYDEGEAVNSVLPGDTVRLHVNATQGYKEITGYRFGYTTPAPGAVITLTPVSNDYEITIDSTSIPDFSDLTTEIVFGGGPATASPHGDGISAGGFLECNAFGELYDDEYKGIVGKCQSRCVKTVKVIRGSHVSIDEFVDKIGSNNPLADCKRGLEREDIMCESDYLSPGAVVTYKVRIKNDGQTDFKDVVLSNKALFGGNENGAVWKILYEGNILQQCADDTCSSFIGEEYHIDEVNSTATWVKWQAIPTLEKGATWEATFKAQFIRSIGPGTTGRVDMKAMINAPYCIGGDGCEDITWHKGGDSSIISMSVVKYPDHELPYLITPGGMEIVYKICFYDYDLGGGIGNAIITVTDYLDPDFLKFFNEPSAISHEGVYAPPSGGQPPTITWIFSPSPWIFSPSPGIEDETQTVSFPPSGDCVSYTLTPKDSFGLQGECVKILANKVTTTINYQGTVANPLDVYARSGVADDVCGATSLWSIDKTFTPSTILKNGRTVVTLSVVNNSGVTAYLQKIEDHLPSGFVLDGAATVVKPNGSSFSFTPSVSGNNITFEFPTSGGQSIEMSNGENTLITFTLRAGAITGNFTNTACVVVPAGGCDSASISVGSGSLPGTGNRAITVIIGSIATVLFGIGVYYFGLPARMYKLFSRFFGDRSTLPVIEREDIKSKFEKKVSKMIEEDA